MKYALRQRVSYVPNTNSLVSYNKSLYSTISVKSWWRNRYDWPGKDPSFLNPLEGWILLRVVLLQFAIIQNLSDLKT